MRRLSFFHQILFIFFFFWFVLSYITRKHWAQPLFSWCSVHLSFTLTVNSDSSLYIFQTSFTIYKRAHTHTSTINARVEQCQLNDVLWHCVRKRPHTAYIYTYRLFSNAIYRKIIKNTQSFEKSILVRTFARIHFRFTIFDFV